MRSTAKLWGRIIGQRQLRGLVAVRFLLLMSVGVLLLLFVWSSVIGVTRIFILDLRTTALTLAFETGTTSWSFPQATVCRRIEEPDFTAPEREGPCGAQIYAVETAAPFEIAWPEGAELELTLSELGELSIEVRGGAVPDLPVGSRIEVDPGSWTAAGAITFAAELTVGAPVSSGQRHYLLDGRWEARQRALFLAGTRDVSEIVKAGEAIRGSTLEVRVADGRALMLGHVTKGTGDAVPVLEVVAVSEAADTELWLGLFGTEKPSVIRPDWIDTAISSPILLALAAVLSVLASMTQVISDLASSFRRVDQPTKG